MNESGGFWIASAQLLFSARRWGKFRTAKLFYLIIYHWADVFIYLVVEPDRV
jgi:hypothetical protein